MPNQLRDISTGLAEQCYFGEQIESSTLVAMFLKKNNKTRQRTLLFAIVFEEGLSQQKIFECDSGVIKEAVFAIDGRIKPNVRDVRSKLHRIICP